jgi:hypothetical protein
MRNTLEERISEANIAGEYNQQDELASAAFGQSAKSWLVDIAMGDEKGLRMTGQKGGNQRAGVREL